MELLESVQFGIRAIRLRLAAARSREDIDRIQRERLEALVAHAREHSQFYREKYASVAETGFELTDLPTTNKSEIMENFDRVLTVADVRRSDLESFFKDEANLGKYFRDQYVFSHTSGSQGQPLYLVQVKDDLELLFALHAARGNREPLGVGQVLQRFTSPARLAAVTLKRGFFPSGTAFEYMPVGAWRYMETLQTSLGDEDMLERLQEFRPTHLTAYASVLHELARKIEAGKLSFAPELEQVVNISERLMPQAREHYEKVFRAPVLDDYAMGECLFLSNGCTAGGGMHVNADWAILEVVDKDNQPVPDGKKGAKVLVTNLANRVQPLIRYEIGDIVTMAAKPCECGSSLPLIERVEGRDSDMFYVDTPEGRRSVQPAIFDIAMASVLNAREYQVIQEDAHRVTIRVEPLSGKTFDTARAHESLREHLTKYDLDEHIQVEVEVVRQLTPDSGAKFKRFVSKVKHSAA